VPICIVEQQTVAVTRAPSPPSRARSTVLSLAEGRRHSPSSHRYVGVVVAGLRRCPITSLAHQGVSVLWPSSAPAFLVADRHYRRSEHHSCQPL
jgi:hypothetical protein